MNIFSKLISLGLLVNLCVMTPSLARDQKDHNKKNTCSIVGSYAGILDGGYVVAQFNEDGTMTVLDINGTNPNIPFIGYLGSWKCVGHKCFKYCMTNVQASVTCPRNEDELCGIFAPSTRTKIAGTICFTDNECTNAEGHDATFNRYALDDFGLTTPLLPPQGTFDFTLVRLNCCK